VKNGMMPFVAACCLVSSIAHAQPTEGGLEGGLWHIEPTEGADWSQILGAAEWVSDGHGDAWSGNRSLSELLVKLNLAKPEEGAPARLFSAQRATRKAERGSSNSKISFGLDGFFYSPVLGFEYDTDSKVLIISTGRGFSCVSEGNSAGLPSAELWAFIDTRIVNLDGSAGATGATYDLDNTTIYLDSRHTDVRCKSSGDFSPDTLRMALDGPREVSVGQPYSFRLRASNKTSASLFGVSASFQIPSGATYLGFSGIGWSCGQSGSSVTCNRSGLNAGQNGTVFLNMRFDQAGPVTLHCTGTMSSAGRVANEPCWHETNAVIEDTIFGDHFLSFLQRSGQTLPFLAISG